MKVIGIIGTHGKTSIVYILEHLFRENGKNVGTISDLGIKINKNKVSCKMQNYEDIICEMEENNISYLIMEIHDTDTLDRISFECIIFCGFYTDDSEHASYSFYRQSLNYCKRIIVNADNEESLKLSSGIKELYTITYGLKNKSTVTASSVSIVQQNTKFNFCLQRGINSINGEEIIVQEIPVETNMIGYQNIYNSLSAITAGLLFDLDIKKMLESLKNIKPIPNRLEIVSNNNIEILIDAAKDNYSIKILFDTLQYMSYKKLYIAIYSNNFKTILNDSNNFIDEFISDFILIQGSNICIIGNINKINLNKKNKKKLFRGLINNRIKFEYFLDYTDYFNKFNSKFSKDDLLVWMGSRSKIIQKNIKQTYEK